MNLLATTRRAFLKATGCGAAAYAAAGSSVLGTAARADHTMRTIVSEGFGRIIILSCYLAEVVLAELKGVGLTRVRNENGIALLQQKR